jgi:hypothetical protein
MKIVSAIVSFPVHVELEVPDDMPDKDRDAALIKEAADWLKYAEPWASTVHRCINPVIKLKE